MARIIGTSIQEVVSALRTRGLHAAREITEHTQNAARMAQEGRVIPTSVEKFTAKTNLSSALGGQNEIRALRSSRASANIPRSIPDAPMYHGTSQPIPGGAFADPFEIGSGNRNLFGAGIYTTDSPRLAGSYTRKMDNTISGMSKGEKRLKTTPTVYGLEWTGPNPPRMLDLEQKGADAPEILDIFRQQTSSVPDIARSIDPELPLRDSYTAIRKALKQNLMSDETDPILTAISRSIQDQGYDGLSHIGGRVHGLSGLEHDVKIFFSEGNLRIISTTDMTEQMLRRQARIGMVKPKANDMALKVADELRARGMAPQGDEILTNIEASMGVRAARQGAILDGIDAQEYPGLRRMQTADALAKRGRQTRRRRKPPQLQMSSSPSSGRMGAVPSQSGRGGVMTG